MNAYSMRNSRKSARITGILFILGTVPVMVAMALWGQSVSSPDYLSLMAVHSNEVLLFALSGMFMGLACAGIGISMYSILKPHGETLALGVVGFPCHGRDAPGRKRRQSGGSVGFEPGICKGRQPGRFLFPARCRSHPIGAGNG